MSSHLHPRSPLARLFAKPGAFDFFQAVRLLERHAADTGFPVGGDTSPAQEAVHLRVPASLRFPDGPITKSEVATADSPPQLWAAFAGLTGPDGILPQHYTALLLARQRMKDTILRDWLDLFHHRILSLFVRAWEKNRWPAVVDRLKAEARGGSARPDRDDPGTRAGLSAAGFGTPHIRGRLQVPDEAAIYYSGILSRQPRTASGLERILNDYFEWPVAIEQLCGQWLYLDEANMAGMPTIDRPGSNSCLGRDVVIGRRVWDVQGKFRIIVGPVDGTAFRNLLPDGGARQPLNSFVRLYAGLELDVEVQVVLDPDAVPWASLDYDEVNGPKLGWNTWVRTHNFGEPVGDVRFGVL